MQGLTSNVNHYRVRDIRITEIQNCIHVQMSFEKGIDGIRVESHK